MKRRATKTRAYMVSNWVKQLTDSAYKLKWGHAPGVKYTGSIADRDRFFAWYMDIMVSNSGKFENMMGELSLMAIEDKEAAVYVTALLERMEGKQHE